MVVNYLQTYSLNTATYFLVVFGWNESPVEAVTVDIRNSAQWTMFPVDQILVPSGPQVNFSAQWTTNKYLVPCLPNSSHFKLNSKCGVEIYCILISETFFKKFWRCRDKNVLKIAQPHISRSTGKNGQGGVLFVCVS